MEINNEFNIKEEILVWWKVWYINWIKILDTLDIEYDVWIPEDNNYQYYSWWQLNKMNTDKIWFKHT